jgi:Protein of unknown function (DUF5818)
MDGTRWIVAAATVAVGIAVTCPAPQASPRVTPVDSLTASQNQAPPAPALSMFTGTIQKTGDQFVFTDDRSKSSYQLDDQKTASKFVGQKVKVVGTLDASNLIIRVQSIEADA